MVLVDALQGGADGLQEVDCFDTALLVEDHDSGAGSAGSVSVCFFIKNFLGEIFLTGQ
jgi:hypothetical protein